MKGSFMAGAILAIAVLSLATPGKSQPTSVDVNNAIFYWGQDVDAVNLFLDTVYSLANPSGSAATTKQTALDEPTQLDILRRVVGLSDEGLGAVNTLQDVFSAVPDDLQSIVDDSSPDNLKAQVDAINNNRCQNVLPALDILWAASAVAVGLAAPIAVNRPQACEN